MPTLEEAADQTVARSEELQRVLRGEEILLFPPGGTALLGANMGILLGWGALAAPTMVRSIRVGESEAAALSMGLYIGLGLVVCMLPGLLVVRGFSFGHTFSRRECRVLFCLSGLVATVSLVRRDTVGVASSAIAVLLFLIADRLTARASYALAAAYFRARRQTAIDLRRRRDEVLGRR